jgi:hypothetical protein
MKIPKKPFPIPKKPLSFSLAATRLSVTARPPVTTHLPTTAARPPVATRLPLTPGFNSSECEYLTTQGPIVPPDPNQITEKKKKPHLIMKILVGLSAFISVGLSTFISIFNPRKNLDSHYDRVTTDTGPYPQGQTPVLKTDVHLEQVATDVGSHLQVQTPIADIQDNMYLTEDVLIEALRLPKKAITIPEVLEFLSEGLHGSYMPNPAGDDEAPYTRLYDEDVPRYLKERNGPNKVYERYIAWKKKPKQRLR